MLDGGLIIVGAKSLSIFCTFKKSAQNHNEKKETSKNQNESKETSKNRNQKKETRKSPFFNFIAFLVVYVICSRVCHL
jgi:L-lactate permease